MSRDVLSDHLVGAVSTETTTTTIISFLSVRHFESPKMPEIKMPLAFPPFQFVLDLKMAASTSGSSDALVALFTANDISNPDTFIEALRAQYSSRGADLLAEAMKVYQIHWGKETGSSAKHETITLCRRAPYSTNVILDRMPPPGVRWFNLCLVGPANDRLTLSPSHQPGDTIWQCNVPTNNIALYVWEVALLARTIHTRFPYYKLLGDNCYLFAGYCAHILRRYLIEKTGGTGIDRIRVGGRWGSSRVFVPNEDVLESLFLDFLGQVMSFRQDVCSIQLLHHSQNLCPVKEPQ